MCYNEHMKCILIMYALQLSDDGALSHGQHYAIGMHV